MIVVGDVNSTVACALGDQKNLVVRATQDESLFLDWLMWRPACEAFDRTMPEEVNRIVTDTLSDYLFTTEESANQNLERRESRPIRFILSVTS